MLSIPGSSITLLVIYLCSLSVVELRIAKPVAYSFGDRLPQSADLQSSSAESKTEVIKNRPVVDVVASPHITPKKLHAKITQYTKNPSSPITRQIFPATYNTNIVNSESQAKSTKKQPIISPVIYNIEPVKKETVKSELLKNDKLLQKPLTFSYNKDLKTAASDGNDYAVAESANNQEGSDHHSGVNIQSDNEDHNDYGNNEPKEWSFKKGRGKNKHSGHYSVEGDKGLHNYDGEHEYEKAEKGHHDKEGHRGKYEDDAGSKKSHHYDDGLYGEYHKGEKGERGAKYDDEGSYSKGHNTKGEHNVHKNEEYEKKQEFYDEFHEGGDEEKHGAFHQESDYKKGGSQKSGHHRSDNHKDHYGKKGHHEKGEHYDEDKGHKVDDAHDEHYKHADKHGKKGAHKGLKKWGHKQGDAYENANHGSSHNVDNNYAHHPHTQHGDYLIVNYGDDGYDGGHASDSHTHYVITHY